MKNLLRITAIVESPLTEGGMHQALSDLFAQTGTTVVADSIGTPKLIIDKGYREGEARPTSAPSEIKGLPPNRDMEKIPMTALDEIIYQGLDPAMAEWLQACPSGHLCDVYKDSGFTSRTFRMGREWPEERDQFRRIPWNRMRVRIEISPRCYMDDQGRQPKCECVLKSPGPTLGSNPDAYYCNNCKGVFSRDELPDPTLTNL